MRKPSGGSRRDRAPKRPRKPAAAPKPRPVAYVPRSYKVCAGCGLHRPLSPLGHEIPLEHTWNVHLAENKDLLLTCSDFCRVNTGLK